MLSQFYSVEYLVNKIQRARENIRLVCCRDGKCVLGEKSFYTFLNRIALLNITILFF